MSEASAYKAYQTFIALKQHFSKTNYDYFKYNGRIKSNINSFRTKKDRFQFERLTRKYGESELVEFLVSNLISNPDVWVGELCRNPDYDVRYQNWKKKKQALTYQFQCDILCIKELDKSFNVLFQCTQMEHPRIFDLYNEGTISLETIIGIDMVLGCFVHWDRILKGDIIWDDFYHMCRQYTPFLNYDVKQRNKFKDILRKEFTSGLD
jgi:hypothetical protein